MAKLKCGHYIITDGCKSCFDLQMIWYNKLKAADFDDAEDYRFLKHKTIELIDSTRPLRSWHINMLVNVTTEEVQITHDYYDRALDLLNKFKFKSALQKRIWELHCQGLSRLKIEEAIKDWHEGYTYKQSQIRVIIKDLEREFEW